MILPGPDRRTADPWARPCRESYAQALVLLDRVRRRAQDSRQRCDLSRTALTRGTPLRAVVGPERVARPGPVPVTDLPRVFDAPTGRAR